MRAACLGLFAAATLLLGACGSGDGAAPDARKPEPPRRIVAMTAAGDVLEIDRAAAARTGKLAAFPWRRDEETGIIYGRPEDLTALPDGRVLVSTCCEPAAGIIHVVDEAGERAGELHGWDPAVDPTGAKVAVGYIFGIAIYEASAVTRASRTVDVDPKQGPPGGLQDPSWSPEGRKLAFTLGGSLGVVPLSDASLDDAEILEPHAGTYWSSSAYTTDGVVAVEQSGEWDPEGPSGASRLLRVDPATEETVQLASSRRPITDVTVGPSGQHLLWVDGGRLRWRTDGSTASLDGDFVTAAWVTADLARR